MKILTKISLLKEDVASFDFPELRQAYEYDCGASATQSVLFYYGIDMREEEVLQNIHTTDSGTDPKNIISFLNNKGLKTDARDMTVKELKRYIDDKVPVIVLVQAWNEGGERKPEDWENSWDSGHYVVAIGYDNKKIYFEDPAVINRAYMTWEEFMKRWHDVDSRNGTKYINYGIAVFGKKPQYDEDEVVHLGK